MAFAVPQGKAEPLIVAETTSTDVFVPLYGSWMDDAGTYSQTIYTPAQLSSMAGQRITSIAYHPSEPLSSNFNGCVLQVSLKEISQTGFSSTTPIDGMTAYGTCELSGGEDVVLFNLDEPFEYSGDNSLVVEVHVKTGAGYATVNWYAMTTPDSEYCSIYHYNTTTQRSYKIPMTTFTYEQGTIESDASKLSGVTGNSYNFGALPVGASKTLNLTLKNIGANAFTPSVTVTGTGFSTTYTAAELTNGQTATIPVVFNPTTAGDFNGNISINCGAAGSYSIDLTGSAVLETTIADGTDYNEYLPVYGYNHNEYNQQNQMVYPASQLTSLIGKKLKSITFYPATVTSQSGYYTTTTSGINFKNGSVTVSLATAEAGTITYSASGNTRQLESALTAVGTISIPSTAQTDLTEWTITFGEGGFVYNGGDLLVDVSTVKGSYGRTYFYGQETTDYAGYSCTSSSEKTGQKFLPKATFAYEDSETPVTPVITANQEALTYETVVGTSRFSNVAVTGENLTEGITATISGTNASYFTVTPATLGAEGGTLKVDYNPTEAGEHTATLTLSSAGAQDVTIALTGTATAPAVDYAVSISDNTGAHNYGNVLVNSSNVWTLTITNNGTKVVTPTLSGIEAPFSTNYTATALAAGESVTITFTFAPTELGESSNTITISFPEAGDAIAAYTCELTGKAVDESYDPSAENEVVKLVTVDKRSIYEPNFIDQANGNTTPQQLNCYDMRFKMAQPDDPTKQIKARDLHPGNNLYEFYAIDDFGTEFRFATINLFAEGEPSSNPSVSAMDAPIKVTPSVEYYTEDGMPVHPDHTHYTTLNYTEKIYNDVNELVDLEGVIDYVNDTWSANTATNSHPDHYKFQIRGVGQFGDLVTSLTSEYVEGHMTGYGNSLVLPEGWERGSWVGPNNEIDGVHSYYYYDLYIKRSFFDERGITGPVTVVVNTTLSGSGFNADNYKAMSVNGVEQIIAKEAFKDYSWTVPLGNDLPENTVVEQVPMGVVIRLVSTGADFNRTTGIYIYGGGTGVSNVDTVNIYKSSMNVKAYTQKQVDEDTDRNLVAMKSADTETSRADVNVLAYGDPAVTGYKLYENSSASTTGITADNHVATATHNETGSYTVNSVSEYDGTYDYVRDESLGNIDGMWLPMYPAESQKYFLPVTVANGIGDDGVVRSEGNTYGSAMQQVEKNGSVAFNKDNSQCIRSEYTWVKDGVRYAIYNPDVFLTSELPAATGYELYNYRLWVDYEDNAPAWDFERDEEGKIHLTTKMDRPLYEGTATHIGGAGAQGRRDEWSFVAPSNLEQIKLVARFYYKKTTGSKARPTDRDRLYYVVENQVTLTVDDAGIVTGIDNVSSKAVANVKYYNMAGIESDVPFQGVNIEVTTYTDGSRTTRKIMK